MAVITLSTTANPSNSKFKYTFHKAKAHFLGLVLIELFRALYIMTLEPHKTPNLYSIITTPNKIPTS